MKRYKPHIQHWWSRALFWLFLFSLPMTQAADLTFTPQTPIVEVGQKITLSVSGTSGEFTWNTPDKGFIDGTGPQVTYRANETGNDVISVLDDAGNTGLVKVVIYNREQYMSLFQRSSVEIRKKETYHVQA
ncbi:secreted protein [Beggiatoa sp. PS]|nr:secreted protein [Beggiatoa sp. PS]